MKQILGDTIEFGPSGSKESPGCKLHGFGAFQEEVKHVFPLKDECEFNFPGLHFHPLEKLGIFSLFQCCSVLYYIYIYSPY